MAGKRVTIIDVAREAGVSTGTVSRVVNGSARVTPGVDRRVRAVIDRLGYEPNSLAQTLRGRGPRTVGCMISDLSNPLYGALLSAAEERLQAAGVMMIVANSHNRPERERELVSLFRRRHVDGLVLTFGDEGAPIVEQILSRTETPIVLIDRDVALRPHCDAVVVDHRAGTQEATRHLLRLGHRRIALLTPPATVRPGRERIEGFREAHAAFGADADPSLIRSLDAATSLAYSHTIDLFQQTARPTAVICLGTQMAAGVLTGLASLGLRVPQDVSVIGIGDTDLARLHGPPLTIIRWDIRGVGRLAAEMLLARIDGTAPAGPRRTVLPTEFVQRDSCAPPAPVARRSPARARPRQRS